MAQISSEKAEKAAWIRNWTLNFIDLAVLAAFAAAFPLLGLLAKSPHFLVVHHAGASEILILVAAAAVLPGLLLCAIEAALVFVEPRGERAVHFAFTGLLLGIFLLPAWRALPVPGLASAALALAAGFGLAWLYLRVRDWRWSLAWLVPVVAGYLAWFLFFSPVAALVLPGQKARVLSGHIGNPVPVILVIFDEFPLASLMNEQGQIDGAFPHFSELAAQATWYRNASASSDATLLSVPAILSGRRPDPTNMAMPNIQGYPQTLFTLLGTAYRMNNVRENNTDLCPDAICAPAGTSEEARISEMLQDSSVLYLYTVLPSDLTRGLPDISQSWAHFRAQPAQAVSPVAWDRLEDADWHDRRQQYQEFLDGIQSSSWPALHFLHILLPHAPWEYLPSGQRFTIPDARIRGLRGVNEKGEDPNFWNGGAWAAAQSYQRHLQQVGMVDELVGRLVARLKQKGLYEQSLIVLTADHGASFRNGDSRRAVTPGNHTDIMSVPLFVKYPHQQQGRVDDRNVEGIDVLPTIADVLQVRSGWKFDGTSLREAQAGSRPDKQIASDTGRTLHFPAMLLPAVLEDVRQKIALFGGSGWYGLYHLGDRYRWVGRSPGEAPPDGRIRYRLNQEAYYSNIDPRGPMLLANITGRLERPADPAPLDLAVAVNGKIGAVTESYREDHGEAFSALVPPADLRAGNNEIAVYAVRDGAHIEKLERIPGQPYHWGTRLTFSKNGNAGPFCGYGWSSPEDGLTWTEGRMATLYLPGKTPGRDVRMAVGVRPFTYGKLTAQTVRVLVNRHEVATWKVSGEFMQMTAVLPRRYLGDSDVEIAFELPDAMAPVALGAGSDSRVLALAFGQMELTPQ